MIFGKLIVTALLTYSLCLLAVESDFIHSIIPYIGWVALGIIVAFFSWFCGRGLANTLLRPFSKVPKKNRAVLVTGCDSGIGLLTAVTLNRIGFYVFAGCLSQDSVNEASRVFKEASSPSRFKALLLDITKEDQIRDCVDNMKSTLANGLAGLKLHGLVNCAGLMDLGETGFTSSPVVDDFNRSIEVNLLGTIRVTRAVLPLIRESRGRIVNISSIMSRLVTPGATPYSVSKAALSKFTECLQVELAPFGVKVIGIEPWIVKTQMVTGKQLIQSLHKSWDLNDENSKRIHSKGNFYQVLDFVETFTSLPYDIQPDQVVRKIIDALTVAEPDPVYRLINPLIGLYIWIVNDILSWEFVVYVRIVLFWIIFKLLSVKSFLRGRS